MKVIGQIIEYSGRLWFVEGDHSLAEETIVMACVTGSVGSETILHDVSSDLKTTTVKKRCKASSIKPIEKIKPS